MQSYEAAAHAELRTSPDLADAAAKLFVAEATGKERFFVALSGGSTPSAMFERLAAQYAGAVDWKRVHFFWGDERTVAPTHKDSNFGVAKAKLLDPVGVPVENIHRFEGERPPTEASARYTKELRRVFGLGPRAFPRFDLLFLGLGEDGHTASLFPGTAALSNQTDPATVNSVPQLNATRLTVTYPTINNAACVAVLVSGKAKAEIVQKVLKNAAEPAKYPMQGVVPKSGRFLWLMDADAYGA